MRPRDGYFFEDYVVGQRFDHAVPRTITPGDISLYQAVYGGRNPVACSTPFAQALGFREAPVDELLVFHIAFGKTVPDISYNAVANLGYADCRFLVPVFAGDTISAASTVLGLRENSNGRSGIVYVRTEATNQHGALVLSYLRWVMVNRRDTNGTPDTKPTGQMSFDAAVMESQIKPPPLPRQPHNATTGTITHATGSSQFWEEVHVGQVIAHPTGITIDNTDHTLATKLFQNTARVHFDHHRMQTGRFGQRLVYGGHVISLCRAHMFDGLENALFVAAINGGSHLNPTFAGDTIYATSTITHRWPINAAYGAIRLTLAGYKNADPLAARFAETPPEQQVLSLDLTVIMPRASA
jgi:2-methylfumaryl-CoA hydratase